MDTLQPYIDDKTLVVKSGQTKIEQVATLRWLQETAQKRMEDLLTSTYSDGSKVQGVLSPYDGLSRGIITALQNAGYGPGIDAGMPIVTGQDSEIASVKLINDGVQYSSIFKDTRKLADQAVTAAQDFLAGKTARGERHQVVRQRRQGRPVLPARLGRRRQGQHPEAADRLGLLDRGRGRQRPGCFLTFPLGPLGTDVSTPAGPSGRRGACPMTTRRMVRPHGNTHSGDAVHHQDVPRRQGSAGRVDLRRARRDPRHLRRERRRQVHPDEGPVRRLRARHVRRHHRLRRRGGAVRVDQRLRGPRASSSSTRSSRWSPTCRSRRTSSSATSGCTAA